MWGWTRYGIISGAAPRVAPADAGQRQAATAKRAPLQNRLRCVLRASGLEAAMPAEKGTDSPLISTHQCEQHPAYAVDRTWVARFSMRFHKPLSMVRSSARSNWSAPWRASNTVSSAGIWCCLRRKHSRATRLMVLRRDARRTWRLPMTSPNRAQSPSLCLASRTKLGCEAL